MRSWYIHKGKKEPKNSGKARKVPQVNTDSKCLRAEETRCRSGEDSGHFRFAKGEERLDDDRSNWVMASLRRRTASW